MRVSRDASGAGLIALALWASLAAFVRGFVSPLYAESVTFECESEKAKAVRPCRISLVSYDYRLPIISLEAGEVREVAAGRYDIRAEAAGLSTPGNSILTVTTDENTGRPHRARLTLVRGGIVSVDPESVGKDGAVQLLSLESGRLDTLFLSREKSVGFPAGRIVAVGFGGPDKVLGVSAPLTLPAGGKVEITGFHRPGAAAGNAVIRVDYAGATDRRDREFDVILEGNGKEWTASAATSRNRGSHYSLFYDLPGGIFTAQLRSERRWSEPVQLEVVAGRTVLNDRVRTLPKPSLKVVRDDPPGDASWRVSIFGCPADDLGPQTAFWPDLAKCTQLRAEEVKGQEYTLEYLDPRWLFLLVEAGGHKMGRQVDLTSGASATERFDARGIRISGKVSRGARGVAARLKFRDLDTEQVAAEAESNPDGRYEASLPSEGMFRVTVAPVDSDGDDPPVFRLPVPTREDLQKDFDLPRSSVRVRVVDEKSREPIAKATVFLRYAGASETRTTNEEGEATLPPVAPGSLRFSATAEGYGRRSVTFEVQDQDAVQEAIVSLKRLREDTAFQLLLPEGGPAGGGQVFVGLLPEQLGFRERETCDNAGECRLTARPNDDELIYLFHPSAGLTIARSGDILGGVASLRPSGGELRITVDRGPGISTCILQAEALLDGARIPRYLLDILGGSASREFRSVLTPGSSQSLVLQGLPSGPFVLSISGNRDCNGSPLNKQVELELPVVSPVQISIP